MELQLGRRPDGFDADDRIARGVARQCDEHVVPDVALHGTKPTRRECAGVHAAALHEREQRGTGTGIVDPPQGVRDGPPGRHRLS